MRDGVGRRRLIKRKGNMTNYTQVSYLATQLKKIKENLKAVIMHG